MKEWLPETEPRLNSTGRSAAEGLVAFSIRHNYAVVDISPKVHRERRPENFFVLFVSSWFLFAQENYENIAPVSSGNLRRVTEKTGLEL